MAADEIISDQLNFFAKNAAGCAFAAHAARDSDRYEWSHQIIGSDSLQSITNVIMAAIVDERISTLSIIFPDVRTNADLDNLLPALNRDVLYLYEKLDTDSNRCFRYRAKIGIDESFVSGFGPFEHMPITRQTPHTSIVFRVKPRPAYGWYLKEPENGIIHVADMNMKGLSDRNLTRMWNNSFLRTRGLLQKKPDEESAAKTTFVIPLPRAGQIYL